MKKLLLIGEKTIKFFCWEKGFSSKDVHYILSLIICGRKNST